MAVLTCLPVVVVVRTGWLVFFPKFVSILLFRSKMTLLAGLSASELCSERSIKWAPWLTQTMCLTIWVSCAPIVMMIIMANRIWTLPL